MTSFSSFFREILEKSGLSLRRDLSIQEVRFIISKINEYFFTNYEGIGFANILDDEFEYFSEFHKFWEKYHKEILNPQIDLNHCEKVAEVLHDVFVKFGKAIFYELYDTFSLKSSEVCKIRYFSANQDFRGSRAFKELFEKYSDDPSIFDKDEIYKTPEDFLKNIGITSLSQNDKRVKYAKTAAQVLIQKNIEPFDLFALFKRDLYEIRKFLLNNRGSGFGNKKTDIFLRDMVILGIWNNPINFDKIDVASDINTVKVALRTGILKTSIPLVSSLLDIFCYQYSLVDEMNALAWRKVWELWRTKFPTESIESPCLIDYFIYRIVGKDFCNEKLYVFECETKEHFFKWHSGRNKTCQVCFKNKVKNKAHVVNKILPCADNDGYIAIEKSNLVAGDDPLLPNLKECPFEIVCKPKTITFKKLNPPKSISILGQTGWESAKTRKDTGGGGLMS
jgi:hypothetical protein